jgi:Xaa-Pro aminopeptidase
MTDSRLARAQQRLRETDTAALFVGPSADLRWLVGYEALPLERLTLLVVPAEGEATLVVPELEVARAEAFGAGEHVAIRAFDEVTDPFTLVEAAMAGGDTDGRMAVQDRLWTMFTLALQARFPGATWQTSTHVTGHLRLHKTVDEIAALHRVGEAIDDVHAKVPSLLQPGRTEAEVGRDIAALIQANHDEVNFVIVGSGPNGASPHHETGARVLEHGDAVVVDIGGTLDGYCSDETRNYAVGAAPDGYAELHAVLEAAQQAAVDAVRPGVTAEAIDAAAREPITDAGFGPNFIHRTGHGIGIEEHEEPWIVAGNAQRLEPGMAFSVEPGIYLPDRHGARIEDIVVVTDDGVASCNHRPHELLVV